MRSESGTFRRGRGNRLTLWQRRFPYRDERQSAGPSVDFGVGQQQGTSGRLSPAPSRLADQDHDALSAVRAARGRQDSSSIREMEVSEHASEQAPTKLGLRPGQTLKVEDAIKALVTRSANDAAVVVAEAIGGDEDDLRQADDAQGARARHEPHGLSQRQRPAQRRPGHHRARSGDARPRDPGSLPALLPLFRDPAFVYRGQRSAITTSCSAMSKASTASRPATPARPASIS
jgi:hypothetical protein